MHKYLYKRVEIKHSCVPKELNKLGDEGWLVIHIEEHKDTITVYLKKDKEEN